MTRLTKSTQGYWESLGGGETFSLMCSGVHEEEAQTPEGFNPGLLI